MDSRIGGCPRRTSTTGGWGPGNMCVKGCGPSERGEGKVDLLRTNRKSLVEFIVEKPLRKSLEGWWRRDSTSKCIQTYLNNTILRREGNIRSETLLS